MGNLFSSKSRTDELKHLTDDIEGRLPVLKKRLTKWSKVSTTFGIGSLALIAGGVSMLVMGILPETINLAWPVVEENVKKGSLEELFEIVYQVFYGGIILALFSSTIMFVMGAMHGEEGALAKGFIRIVQILIVSTIPTLANFAWDAGFALSSSQFEIARTQIEKAGDDNDWAKAHELLTPFTTKALMLKAQVAYKAGHEAESIALVKKHDLGSAHPSEAWLLENLFSEHTKTENYEMTEASQAYAADKASKRQRGASLLTAAIPLVFIALLTGFVALVLRRNIDTIEQWATDTEELMTEYPQNNLEYKNENN